MGTSTGSGHRNQFRLITWVSVVTVREKVLSMRIVEDFRRRAQAASMDPPLGVLLCIASAGAGVPLAANLCVEKISR
jgi:hypothetical protein